MNKPKRKFEPMQNLEKYFILTECIAKDGRTTIMVRNIPNKYTQSLILEEIDETHKNCYDFFYLPIDFTVFPQLLE